jgi:hypothetical protein
MILNTFGPVWRGHFIPRTWQGRRETLSDQGIEGTNLHSIPQRRREEADRHWPFKGMTLHDHAW